MRYFKSCTCVDRLLIMRNFLIALSFLFILTYDVSAQISLVNKALKAQYKHKLDKAEKLIEKAIKKDSILPAVYYAKASLLFDEDYTYYNIDSAYKNLKKGRMFFASLDEKQMRKHLGIGVDLVELNRLKAGIEQAAFQRAESINTEEGYIDFLEKFNGSKHQQEAIENRDSLAFIYASDINTYQAYEEFMEKYPNAIQVPDAKRKYERLYFYKSTADGKLKSYLKYLDKHPITPYRRDAEKAIFDISTADNETKSYLSFIKKFPDSQYAKKAKRLLFYLDPLAYSWKSDSLENVRKLNSVGPLILFNKTKKYGYVDYSGTLIVPPSYNDIKPEYLCSTLRSDFFQTNHEVVARNQAIIFSGLFNEAIDIGMGVLFINTPSGGFLMHKSGWPITSKKIHHAQIVGSFISFKLNDKWGLMTLGGKELVAPKFDEIFAKGNYYFFRKGELFDISNRERLAASADNAVIKFQTIYSEFEIMNDGYLWVQSNYGESLLDKNLHEVIPYGKKNIFHLNNGYVVTSSSKNEVLNEIYSPQLSFDSGKTEFNEQYLTHQNQLYYLHEYKNLGKYDSLELKGNSMALAYRNDSTFLFFKDKQKVLRNQIVEVRFLNATGTAQYLGLPKQHGKGWVYYNEEGKMA